MNRLSVSICFVGLCLASFAWRTSVGSKETVDSESDSAHQTPNDTHHERVSSNPKTAFEPVIAMKSDPSSSEHEPDTQSGFNSGGFQSLVTRIQGCYDSSTAEFRRTPECSNAIEEVRYLAFSTVSLNEMDFVLSALRDEIAEVELMQVTESFLARVDIEAIGSSDVFGLWHQALSRAQTKAGTGRLMREFHSLDEAAQQRWMDQMVNTVADLVRSDVTRSYVLKEASAISERVWPWPGEYANNRYLPSDDLPTNDAYASLLSVYTLRAAISEASNVVEYAFADVVRARDPFAAAVLVEELGAYCALREEFGECVDTIQLTEVQELLVAAGEDPVFSEDDREIFLEYASLL